MKWIKGFKEEKIESFKKYQRARFELVLHKTALNKSTKKFIVKDSDELARFDPVTLFFLMKDIIISKLKENLQTKARIGVSCTLIKSNPATGEEIKNEAHFSSKQKIILEGI